MERRCRGAILELGGASLGTFRLRSLDRFCGTAAVGKTTRTLAITRSKTDYLRERARNVTIYRASAELAPSAREPVHSSETAGSARRIGPLEYRLQVIAWGVWTEPLSLTGGYIGIPAETFIASVNDEDESPCSLIRSRLSLWSTTPLCVGRCVYRDGAFLFFLWVAGQVLR